MDEADYGDEHERRMAAGRWLRAERDRRGLTPAQLADKIGVGAPQISNYERGKNAIDDRRAALIAGALGMAIIDVRRGLGMWVPDDEPSFDAGQFTEEELAQMLGRRFGMRPAELRELIAGYMAARRASLAEQAERERSAEEGAGGA